MGECVPTCQVSLGLMAEGERGDEREAVKAKGLGKLPAQGTQGNKNQTCPLTELRHSAEYMSVSEVEKEKKEIRTMTKGARKRSRKQKEYNI